MKKVLLLGVCSLFALNDAQAGKFKEIFPDDQKSINSKIILQFDDDEERRGAGATIEIGKIGNVLKELGKSIEENHKKGYQIVSIDFSNSDLVEDEVSDLLKFLKSCKIKIPYLNVSSTHVELVSDNEIVDINNSMSPYMSKQKLQEMSFINQNIYEIEGSNFKVSNFEGKKFKKIGKITK